MPVLKSVIKFLAVAKKSLWLWFDAFNDDKLYVLSRTDVFQKYIDFKIDDIEEFAAIYTYERHDIMGRLDDRESNKASCLADFGLPWYSISKKKVPSE